MPNWKKGFRKLPPKILSRLSSINEDDIKIIAGKGISESDVAAGMYAHLGLNSETLKVGEKWEVVPDDAFGITSRGNVDGWETVRKDLPTYKKYFYHDIQNFGDASRNGWSTVAIPRDVYERDFTPPYLFHIEVHIQQRLANGDYGVVFSIDEIFSKKSLDFTDDLLFALNLLQENAGISDIAGTDSPKFVFTSELSWDVFPPGNMDDLVTRLSTGASSRTPHPENVRARLQLFEQFEPIQYLKGMGGNDHYIGAKYTDNLVVFENLKYGNALYVLYGDWEQLAQKPRSELLKLSTKDFDRIVHSEGWENIFVTLITHQLRQRGKRIRVGRNTRRNRQT